MLAYQSEIIILKEHIFTLLILKAFSYNNVSLTPLLAYLGHYSLNCLKNGNCCLRGIKVGLPNHNGCFLKLSEEEFCAKAVEKVWNC